MSRYMVSLVCARPVPGATFDLGRGLLTLFSAFVIFEHSVDFRAFYSYARFFGGIVTPI
jgi:hypothetical protein